MGKRYMCYRWPQLTVGPSAEVKFSDGYFTAETEEQEKLVEGLTYFGPLVWEEPLDEPLPTPRDVVEYVAPPVDSSKKDKKWRTRA